MIVIKNGIKFILISLLITNNSCECVGDPIVEIIDDYQVWSPDGDRWTFMCQLGCPSHPTIQNVVQVEWNDNTIIVQNRNSVKRNEWYIFYSKEDTIKCCYSNTILGPLDSIVTYEFLTSHKLKLENKKTFRLTNSNIR